ncbi:acid protease [Amylocystis lapponica]|nr:acid protease [Amylocystis lapponica]
MLGSLQILLFAASLALVNAVRLDLNRVTGTPNAQTPTGVGHYERARASFLRSRASSAGSDSDTVTVPATQFEYVTYTLPIGVGSPPTYYDLIVDTGSSNTFVGSGKPYVRTSTSIPTGDTVNVTYGIGFFDGDEYYDQVTIAPGLIVKNQSIGDALQSASFEGVDGIIGLGPKDLTRDTLSPDTGELLPTVMDNALAQNLIQQEVIGVSFVPATTPNDTDGAITFGSIDSSLYIGEIQYVPVTETFPSSAYWGINITYATLGAKPLIPGSFAGIVDTGTTQILLADDWFQTYIDTLPGAYVDDTYTGLIVIPESAVPHLQPIVFFIGDSPFTLMPSAQLVPKSQNTDYGGNSTVQYGIVGSAGAPSGTGLDFILGQKFMERYYAVFDTTNQRVGFGFTEYTFSPGES